MKGIFRSLIVPFAILACASLHPAFVWHGEAGETDDSTPNESRTPDAASTADAPDVTGRIRTADAVSMEAGGIRHTVSLDTHLEVEQDVQIMARMSGIVEKILVDRGSRVGKGDILLQLDNRDLELVLERAEIIRDREDKEFRRAETLFEKSLIPRSDYEAKDLDWKRAQVDVEIAREVLERSRVRAPFDGLITDRFAKVGQKIIEDENQPLFRLTTLAPLQAKLFLEEEIAGQLRQGDEVEVLPRYRPEVTVPGRIGWISPVIDASSGTCQAIVTVPDQGPFGELQPGISVTVRFSLDGARGGVLVPISVLDGDSGPPRATSALIEVMEGDRPSWRRVRLGQVHGDRIEVLEGLRAGEKVVLRTE